MSFYHKLNQEDRRILRHVVKTVHMKYYPKDFITDYEADKLIASIQSETLESLLETGKNYKIDQRQCILLLTNQTVKL